MRLVPDSHGLREFNHCHKPSGPGGGQFCSAVDGVSTARDDTPAYGRDDSIKYWGPKRRTQVDTPGGPGIITGFKWKGDKAEKVTVDHPHLTSPGQHFISRTYDVKDVHPKTDTAKDDTPTYGSIPASLAKAGASQHKLETNAAAHLDALPDGTTLKDGKAVWTKEKVGGDVFWTSSKGRGKSSRQMFVDAAGKLVSAGLLPEHLRYGGPEKKAGSPKAYVDALFKLGMRSPMDPRELVLGVGDGAAIIEPRAYDDHVYLTAFRTTEQGKGYGGSVLKKLTTMADQHGVTLRLVASPMAVHAPLKKTPKARLIAFYKRHGFTPDPVYTASSGHMIRTPQ